MNASYAGNVYVKIVTTRPAPEESVPVVVNARYAVTVFVVMKTAAPVRFVKTPVAGNVRCAVIAAAVMIGTTLLKTVPASDIPSAMNVMYAAYVYVKSVRYATVRYAPHAMSAANVETANAVEDPVVITHYANIAVGVPTTRKTVPMHHAAAVMIGMI